MKKTAVVFAGLALSSFCLAAPVTGGVQGSGSASSQGGLNADVEQSATQRGGMESMELNRNAPAVPSINRDDASAAIFTALDRNGDGNLDKGEAKSESSLNEHFSAIDADANGTVSREEYMGRDEAIQNVEEEAE